MHDSTNRLKKCGCSWTSTKSASSRKWEAIWLEGESEWEYARDIKISNINTFWWKCLYKFEIFKGEDWRVNERNKN